MNAPVLLAQLQGNNTPTGTSPRHIKLEKPQSGATVTVYLNGPNQLDFADIASEKLTFVRVGDKLIVLFDNQSTVTLEPVFGPDGHPLGNLSFEMAPDHMLTGDQFASQFPIGTDQSILPAAGGGGGGPTAGAHFSDPTVDQLSTGTALGLLNAENFGSTFDTTTNPAALAAPVAGTPGAVIVNEDGLPGGNPGGPGDVATLATTVTGALGINFQNGPHNLSFAANQTGLNNLTSDGQPVHLFIGTLNGQPILVGYVGTDPSVIANEVFTVSLDATTPTGSFTVHLLRPLDHPIIGTEDTLDLPVSIVATNSAGSSTTILHVEVNDDSPIINVANETHSTITDVVPGSVVTATGSLGISWGADNFNDNVDGGVSATTGKNGDRAVIFTDANVTAVGEAGSVATAINTLTSDGQAVHYALLHNGTELVAYTGTTVPTTFPADATSAASEHVVFTVSLSDASNTGSYVVSQYAPLDHNTGATLFDAINLSFHFTATDSDGDPVAGTLTATVNDTAATVTEALVTHSTLTDPTIFNHSTATGTLGIAWGSDNFNAVVDGGVTAPDGDRAVIFANTNVTTTGDHNGVVTSFAGLTSENQAVHYVLLDNGTVLVAYTGDTAPTTVPTSDTGPIPSGDHPLLVVSSNPTNVVFVVTLTDDSTTGGYSITQYQPLDHVSNGTTFDSVDLTFNFTAIDSDGDQTAGTLTVTVNDTVPTVTGVVFDQFVGEDGLPDGNHIKGDIQTLSVTSSLDINWGADNEVVTPGSHFGRTLSFLAGDDSTAIAGSSATVSSLAMTISGEQGSALTSQGVALVYVVSSDGEGGETLTAHQGSATGAVIFTLSLDATAFNGAYTFTLSGPLDDAVGSNNIALTFTVQATDADGDTVNQIFTVDVQDDVPVAGQGQAESVKEANLFDGSSPDLHDLVTTGNLNIAWGADNHDSGFTNNRSVSFQHATASADVQVTDDSGNTITGLTSNGHTVQYGIFNGVLVGYVNNDPLFEKVFTVSLNDDGTGSYTFTLLNNLDHPAGNGNNNLLLTFDYTATDSDGDPSINTFTVTVVDDVPTAGPGDTTTVSESNLPDGTSPLLFHLLPQSTGDLHIVWGADNNINLFGSSNSRSVSFTDLNVGLSTVDSSGHTVPVTTPLTSDGVQVQYELVNGTLVGYTGSPAHPNVVFTVSLSDLGNGSYTFTLFGNLDDPSGHGANQLNLTFDYTATDSDGDTSNNHFTVDVRDDVPTASSVSAKTFENGSVTFALHDNVGADDGPAAFVTLGTPTVSNAPSGLTFGAPSVVLNADGTVTVTPGTAFEELAAGQKATLTIPYTITDSDGDSASSQISVVITGVNDPPVTADHTAATIETSPYVFQTSDFAFSDIDRNSIENVIVTTLPGTGSLTDHGVAVTAGEKISIADIANGALEFTSGTGVNFDKSPSFQFEVEDNGGTANGGHDTSAAATMTVDVTRVGPTGLSFTEATGAGSALVDGGGTSLARNDVFGTFTETGDPNNNDTFTYSIVRGPPPDIAFNATTGVLSVGAVESVGFIDVPFTVVVSDDKGDPSVSERVTLWIGNGGNDVADLTADTSDIVLAYGLAGNDTFKFTSANFGAKDYIVGGAGTDTIQLTDTGVTVTDAQFVHVSSVETLLIGGSGANVVTLGVNASADVGPGGTFIVDDSAGTGSLTVDGSAMTANLTVVTGSGPDNLTGGSGNDTFEFKAANFDPQTVHGGGGTDTIAITDSGATLVDADFANVSGIETLKVQSATITLGADASAEIGTGTLTVDATAENDSFSGSVVDFTAMTAKFAFVGGALLGDSVTVTNAQFESGLSLSIVDDFDEAFGTVTIADAAAITDAAFAHVTQFAILELGDFTNSVTLGTNAAADAASTDPGFASELTVDGSAAKAGHDLTVDATAFDDSQQLDLIGGAGDDLFKVTAAGLDFGNFFIDGGAGSNTIELVETANFTLIDSDFANVTNVSGLIVDGASGTTGHLTLGTDVGASANGASVFTVLDTSGQEDLTIDGSALTLGLTVELGSGTDTIIGGKGTNTFTGGTGADDFIYNVGATGFETVTGGAGPGIETQTVNSNTATAETFVVGAIDATHLGVSIGTSQSNAALAISDTNVQELVINLGSHGDTVVVSGSLDGTGLAENTITINGGAGNDTVDLSKFTSGQDVVYNGAGNTAAGDTVIYGFASTAATFAAVLDSHGKTIGATITYQSADGPVTDTITNVENFKFTDKTLTFNQLFPIVINSGNTGSEAEGTAVTNVVYHIAAMDADPNAVLTYSLTGNDAGAFNVSSTGDVTFKSVPNFETQNSYAINVNVSNGVATSTEAVTISVTDVAPVAVADSYVEVKNTTATVNAAQGVLANDSDVAGGALTAVLISGPTHDSSFTLNADGSFTYKAASNYTGPDSFTYEASDGTDLSNPVTVSITVNNANDAPVLHPFGPQLTSVHGINGGQTVASFIGSSITDIDAGAVHGIAITADTQTNGTWQFSTNGGVSWTNFSTVSGTSSLLLRDTDLVRYTPSNNNGLSDTFTYRAWDETSGSDGGRANTNTNGNATAFSTATDTAHITETTGANHAPVLTPSAPTLAVITEDQTNPAGTTIATLLGSHVTDADGNALQGIAISGATSTHGTWEYSTNSGSTWHNFATYSTTSALLLAASDEVRFVPDAIDGSTDTFSFVAWDQTTGTHGNTADITTTGGTTAFSTASDAASISVTAIDDAPVVHVPTGSATAPQGVAATITGISVSDVDAGNAPIAVTLSVAHGAISLASTAGLTFTDSDGSDGTLAFTGSQTAIDAALASGVVYTSAAGYLGSDAISVLVNDLGNTGQGGPLTATGSASISVVTPHHAPAGTDNAVTINEDTHYTFAAADFGFSDPNDTPADTFTGVVITTLPTNGALTDNGAAVTAGELIGIADINAHDLVFTPAANANGAMSFTFQVQDNGIAFAPENTDQSPNTMTVNVTAVNDPPTISYAGPQSTPSNIVVNGGFETGDISGWTQSEISIMATNGGGLSHSGFHAVEAFFNFGGPAQDLDQTLTTVVGQTYTYDFWVMHSTAVPSLSDSFTATFGSTQLVSLTGAAAENSFLYTEFTGTVVATSTSTVLDFNFFDSNNNGGGYIWYLDDVSVVAKPQNIASVNEGTNLFFSTANGNAIQVADIDVNETPAPNNIMQVTLGVAHGELTLSETAGISFISGGNATGAMVIQGTLAALDSALNGLTYQADNYNGADTLSINVNDLGHTGIGGPQTASSSVAITVVPNIPASFGGTDTGSVTEAGGVNNAIPGTPTTGGTLIVTDPDSPATIVIENNIATLYGHFSITSAGVWSYTLDNTNPAVDALNVTSTPLQDVATVTTADGSQHQIAVTIHGADDAPATPIDSNAAINTVTEGAANGSTVGITVSATDVDGPALTYSLTGDTSNGGFTIDPNTGIVTVLDSTKFNYQASGTPYTVTAQASDGTFTSSQTFTIAAVAVDNGVGTLTIADTTPGRTLSTPLVGDVLQATLSPDPDGNPAPGSVAYQWFDNGHAISNANGSTYTVTSNDIGDAITATATYTDGQGFNDTSTSGATGIVSADHPPVITSAPESGTVIDGFSSTVTTTNLVTNGGFENQSNPLANWTVFETIPSSDIAGATSAAHSGTTGIDFETGGQLTDFVKASQVINNTVAGVTYTISFWVAENGTNGPSTLNVLWNGATALALSNVPSTGSFTNFVEYSVNVVGTGAPTTLEFDFHNKNAFIMDDISMTSVGITPGIETTGGTITFTDADAGDTHAISVAQNSNVGSFSATLGSESSSGSTGTVNWTFSATDAQITALVAPQHSVTETYTVVIDDGRGGEALQNVTVTLTNPDHAPVAVADTVAVNEDATAAATTRATGVLGNDTDADGDTLTVTSILAGTSGTPSAVVSGSATVVHGVYGDLSINADGTYSYSPNNANAEALAQGQAATDTFTYTESDGHGGTPSTTLTFNITGQDDAPVNSVPGAQTVTSPATTLVLSSANGDALSVSDVDNSSLSVTLTVLHGNLTLHQETGLSVSGDGSSTVTFSGTIGAIDAALDGLTYAAAPSYSGSDTLQIISNDGILNDTDTVGITVIGPDNAPMITSAPETGTVVANASFGVPLGQLISDGGFENFALSPPWTVVLGQPTDTAQTTGGGHSGDDASFRTATVNAGDVIKLSETLNTVAGIPYTVTFWFQASPAGGSFSSLRASWDGTSEVFLQNMATAGNWVEETFNVIGTGSDTLQFNMQDRVTFISLDDISVQANFTPGSESTSGQITFTDADVGDTHTISVAPNSNAGTFTATLGAESSNGSTGTVNWTFSISDAQLTALVAAQQTVPETYNVTINDGHGGVTSQAVTIDLTNPDHAPHITSGAQTGSVTEYLSNSINPVQLIQNGGFESNTNKWTVTLNSGLGDVQEFQSFPAQAGNASLNVWTGTDNPGDVVTLKQSVAGTVAGEAYTLTFFVSNQDDFDPANFIHVLWNNQAVLSLNAIPLSGFGVYTEYSATVAGTGATSTLEFDFQNAGGDYTLDSVSLLPATTPGTEQTAGVITFTDADAGDIHTVSVAPIAGATGYIGTLAATVSGDSTSSNPGTVNWTYTVSDAAAASIGAGHSVTQTYVVTISDGHGGVITQNVTVTINGAAPDVTPPTVTFLTDTLHSSPTNDTFTGKISDNATGLVTIQLFSGNSPGTIVSGASTSVFVTGGAAAANWTISANTSLTSGSGHAAYVQATDASGNVAISANKTLPAGVTGSPVNLALTDYSDHSGLIAATITGLAAGWALSEGVHNADGSWSVLTSDIGSLTVTSPDGYVGALVLNVSESWTNANGTHGTATVADNVEAYAHGAPIFASSGDDSLTASSGNDTLVFANRIGNDVVHNFDSVHDKIDLVGFNGFASFADVQAHLGHDAAGNAVITLGNGETITLNGVDAATLNAGDFQFDQTPVTTNTGDMVIGDGALLPLSGIVDNSGTIHVSSAGTETDLEIVQHGVTLQGGGSLILSDNAENVIFGSDQSVTLTNVDNTISGAGHIGDGQMTLVNDGTIIADGTNALDIDTGSNAVVNSGTLEALGLGGLAVHSDLVNEGVLWANGSNLTLDGDVSGGGSARISGNAGLEIGGAFGEQVLFDDDASGTLKIDHSADFKGILSGLANHDAIDLGDILAATASISYSANAADTGGVLTVTGGNNTANIALSGQYASADFHIAADQTNHALVQIEQHAQHMAAAA